MFKKKKKFFAVSLATTLALSSVVTVTAETAETLTTKNLLANTGIENLSGDFNVTYTLHQKAGAFGNSFMLELRDASNNCIDARSDNWGWTYTDADKVVNFTDAQKAITLWPSDDVVKEAGYLTAEGAADGWAYIAAERAKGVDAVANARRSGDTFYFEFTESNANGPIVTWTYTIDFPVMADETTITLSAGGEETETEMTNIKFTRNPSVYVQTKSQDDGNYTIRVLAEISLDGAFTDNVNSNYSSAGFRCSKLMANVPNAEAYLSSVVFSSVQAGGKEIQAADGKYFVVTEITDIGASDIVYVRPTYKTSDNKAGDFCDKTYTINMADILAQ